MAVDCATMNILSGVAPVDCRVGDTLKVVERHIKVFHVDEYYVARIRNISEVYEARLAIWETCKRFKKKTNRYPTHIFIPHTMSWRFNYLLDFLGRAGVRLASGDVPFDEFWLGYCSYEEPVTQLAKWQRKPPQKAELLRAIGSGLGQNGKLHKVSITNEQRMLFEQRR